MRVYSSAAASTSGLSPLVAQVKRRQKARPCHQSAGAVSRRVWLDRAQVADAAAYPFCLPFLSKGFELGFNRAITIIVGENGTGKSTLLGGDRGAGRLRRSGRRQGIPAGRSLPGHRGHGRRLSQALRASWLPKITNGWFFRAESFFSVARYLDEAASRRPFGGPPPDFLSHSHGEGFLRFFEERCHRQGLFIFDEPGFALSPRGRSSS